MTVILIIYLVIDFSGPGKIPLKEDRVFGLNCLRAKDLIVQEFDSNGDLWATRGMIVYSLPKGEREFIKVAHVPTRFSIFWLRNFTIVRRLTLRPECVELVRTGKGDLCALSAGILWALPAGEKKFTASIKIAHYGFGDQGVRNDGILSIGESTVYFGEYFSNEKEGEVNLLRSTDDQESWQTAYHFPPGEIRHIHAVQSDPYTGKIWLCTGDANPASRVGWTDDHFNTLHTIGSGSQMWRVCQLAFTEEAVYWGTDTSVGETTGIFKWNRKSGEIRKLADPAGAVFFGTRLEGGTVILSTNRQGYSNELDKKTRLWVIGEEDQVTAIECGTWKAYRIEFWDKFAQLRFQRNQGSPSLVVSVLNQKELRDGDLLIIDEGELVRAVDEAKPR
ncbi:MAG: hypothetical protein V2B15_17815 [Bacteroidota bacterium]